MGLRDEGRQRDGYRQRAVFADCDPERNQDQRQERQHDDVGIPRVPEKRGGERAEQQGRQQESEERDDARDRCTKEHDHDRRGRDRAGEQTGAVRREQSVGHRERVEQCRTGVVPSEPGIRADQRRVGAADGTGAGFDE